MIDWLFKENKRKQKRVKRGKREREDKEITSASCLRQGTHGPGRRQKRFKACHLHLHFLLHILQSVSPSSLSQSAPSYTSGSGHGKAASETVYAKSKGPSHRPALAEAGAGIEDGVCILVCGEAGVGKTAIIDTLFSRSFRSDMDRDEDDSLAGTREDGADWSECQIPGQLNTPRGIPTTLRIIDTRSREAALHKLHEAHAIVLVYDVGRPRTFNAATDDWLQALKRMADLDYNRKRRSTRMLPVVLVGNKIDVLAGDNTVERDLDLEKKVIPVLKAHREVEACLECSARAVLNIRQVFYYAQRLSSIPFSHCITWRSRSSLLRLQLR